MTPAAPIHLLIVLAGIHGTVRGSTAYVLGTDQVMIANQIPAQVYDLTIPLAVRSLEIRVAGHTLLRWPEDSARLTGQRADSATIVLDFTHGGV